MRGCRQIKDIDSSLFEDFFRSISNTAGMNLHHIFETIFKGFDRALQSAVKIHPKTKGVPSTKGML